MSLPEALASLQQRLADRAGRADIGLRQRFALRYAAPTIGLYRRLRRLAANLIRWARRYGLLTTGRWEPGLQQVEGTAQARPLVIWSEGMDRAQQRVACQRIQPVLAQLPDYAPVLVTDVADFAFYSRLGWLVEYLPALSGQGDYAERKACYLAWFYGQAPALPLSLAQTDQDLDQDLDQEQRDMICQWVRSYD